MNSLEEKMTNLQTKLEELASAKSDISVAYLTVKNDWISDIRFAVEYTLHGVTFSWNSNVISKGTEKNVPVIEGATKIRISCDFRYKIPALTTLVDKWVQLFTMNFSAPVTETYRVYGTAKIPKYDQLAH